MVSPLVFLLLVRRFRLPLLMFSVFLRPVSVPILLLKPKGLVIPSLFFLPLPRLVLESNDVFLKNRLWDPPPSSGPLPVWKCPVCGFENFNKFGAKSAAKIRHYQQAHPEIPKHIYAPGKVTPVPEATDLIPADQRAWPCAICNKGLPTLPPSERMRAIKKHIQDHHPDETPRSPDSKRRIGSKASPTFRESISRYVLQVRQKQYPSHHLVMVVTRRPHYDRRNFWRRDCFSIFKATTGTAKFGQPCKMRQQEMASDGWVLARKRYWWNNLLKNNPEAAWEFLSKADLTLESVNSTLRVGVETDSTKRWQKIKLANNKPASSKASKVTPSQSSKVSSRRATGHTKPTRKAKRVSKVAKAKWRHGGLRGIRLGEASHPGPGPQKLHVLSCNAQGAEGAWRFLHTCALASNADVILLQEVSFSTSMVSSFRSSLKKSPFNVFFQQGTLNRQRRFNGGVAILVRKELDQKFAFSKCGDHSQSLYVWVNGSFLGSVYAPPHEDSPAEAAAQFLDFQISCEIPTSARWFIGGDFNEEPGKSHFEDTCSVWHGATVRLGEPTRWEGRREIDFFVTSFPEGSSEVISLPLKVSDHKILSTSFLCPSHTKETVRYKKGPVFCVPDSCTSETWRDALSTAWEQVDSEHNITFCIGHEDWDVQSQWDMLQHGLAETFVRATQQFEPNTKFSPSRIAAKGAVASFAVNSQHVNKAEPQLGHMAERKLRRRLARHYELIRLKKRKELSTSQQLEHDALTSKLFLSTHVSLAIVQKECLKLSQLLHDMESHRKNKAISGWRQRMATGIRAVSSLKVAPPLVLSVLETVSLKTWFKELRQFLITGLAFGSTSKVINLHLMIELRPFWLGSQLVLRCSLNTLLVFN